MLIRVEGKPLMSSFTAKCARMVYPRVKYTTLVHPLAVHLIDPMTLGRCAWKHLSKLIIEALGC